MGSKSAVLDIDVHSGGLKDEIENLRSKKNALEKEIEDKKAVHNQEVDRKNMALREEISKVAKQKEELAKQRAEFTQILVDFKKEKEDFEKEKATALNMKENYTRMNEKYEQFMMLIKRAAANL